MNSISYHFVIQYYNKHTNILIIGVPEEEEDKKKDHEKILEEIILKTSLKWGRKYSPKYKKPRESQTG